MQAPPPIQYNPGYQRSYNGAQYYDQDDYSYSNTVDYAFDDQQYFLPRDSVSHDQYESYNDMNSQVPVRESVEESYSDLGSSILSKPPQPFLEESVESDKSDRADAEVDQDHVIQDDTKVNAEALYIQSDEGGESQAESDPRTHKYAEVTSMSPESYGGMLEPHANYQPSPPLPKDAKFDFDNDLNAGHANETAENLPRLQDPSLSRPSPRVRFRLPTFSNGQQQPNTQPHRPTMYQDPRQMNRLQIPESAAMQEPASQKPHDQAQVDYQQQIPDQTRDIPDKQQTRQHQTYQQQQAPEPAHETPHQQQARQYQAYLEQQRRLSMAIVNHAQPRKARQRQARKRRPSAQSTQTQAQPAHTQSQVQHQAQSQSQPQIQYQALAQGQKQPQSQVQTQAQPQGPGPFYQPNLQQIRRRTNGSGSAASLPTPSPIAQPAKPVRTTSSTPVQQPSPVILQQKENHQANQAPQAPQAPQAQFQPKQQGSVALSPTTSVNNTSHHVPKTAGQNSAPTATPTQSPSPEVISSLTKKQILAFEPTAQDRQISQWLKEDYTWDNIVQLLKLSNQMRLPLAQLQFRQQLYQAKHNIKPEAKPAQKEAPIQPLSTSAREPQTAPVKRPERDPDASAIARQVELDKLAWQTEKSDLERTSETLRQELQAERQVSGSLRSELEEANRQLRLKTELQDKLAQKNDEVQQLKQRLQDERVLRNNAEQNLTEKNRRELARAGASRAQGRAQGSGFTFSKLEASDDEKAEKKKTPVKKKVAVQKAEVAHQREDGRPSTGGKTISQAMLQNYMKHYEASLDVGEEEEVEEEPQSITQDNLTYFLYTVRRKQWLKSDPEPEVDGIVCSSHTYLNRANAQVQREVLRPFGDDGIAIEQDKDFRLHGGRGDFDMSWAQVEVPNGFVKVWVERDVHTAYEGVLPTFEPKGMLSRTVFAVKQEHCRAGENVAVAEEQGEIYTTFDLANRKASDRLFNLQWADTSMRIDDVQKKSEADRKRKQTLEDLEDKRELFSERLEGEEGEEGSWIKIWVVQKTVVGPRN